MNGAESLIQAAIEAGIEVCFANPGTTELPLVRALDDYPGVRAVLCLFEGVCTGAADGYGRMAGKPAMTLLHLGPGFANGIAYLHDARRSRSPIVNLIGEHATWHREADPPLHSDIESLATPVSAWLRRCAGPGEMAADVREAIAVASVRPGRIATLITPHDHQLGEASNVATLRTALSIPSGEASGEAIGEVLDDRVGRALAALHKPEQVAIFLGGYGLRERGLRAVGRIAAVTGVKLICESFPARWERGAGYPLIERLPYFPEPAMAMLAPFRTIILAGARSPVAFFGYPGLPSLFISPKQETHVLAGPEDDVETALEALAEALGAPVTAAPANRREVVGRPSGALNPDSMSAAVAAVLPDGAIVMDEGNTSTGAFCRLTASGARHSYLMQPGGAIGLGMPCATGAAIACPDRPVITLQSDGSGMYTVQSLWTMAREGLNIKTIICNNRSYRILGVEMMRAGLAAAGPQARSMVGLDRPSIDWCSLSRGLGVPAESVDSADGLAATLERVLAEPGPFLIEALL